MDSDSDSFDKLGESSEDEKMVRKGKGTKMDVEESELSEEKDGLRMREEDLGPQVIEKIKEVPPSMVVTRPEVRLLEGIKASEKSQPESETIPRPTTGGKSLLTILNTLKRGPSLAEFRSESRTQTVQRMEKCSEKIMEFFEANKEIITFDK